MSQRLSSDRLGDALNRLNGLVDWERGVRASMRIGLDPVSDLLARLGNPERSFRSVHVTGTKGKGSVCALIEAALRGAGYKVGRYASPHVDRINERISHGLRLIGDEALAAVLGAALDARDDACEESTAGKDATWFDVFTAAAFSSFRSAGLEWVVVEVGMGGRFDSTNTIQPEIAVITNIALEHTNILGDTKEEIAFEKAGIIKSGAELVTQVNPDTPEGFVIQRVAAEQGVSVVIATASATATIVERNAVLARTVLSRLGARGFVSALSGIQLGAEQLTDEVVKTVALPGRLERRTLARVSDGGEVEVVIDGGHVAFAIEEVFAELQKHSIFKAHPVVILALASDKDVEAIISALASRTALLVCTTLPGGKSFWEPEALSRIAVAKGVQTRILRDPEAALAAGLTAARGTWVLVIGSLHLAGKVRAILNSAGSKLPYDLSQS